MPIEFKKEGNACERCKKLDTEVGRMEHYQNYGIDKLLCKICIDELERYYADRCSDCERTLDEVGEFTQYEDKMLCTECYNKSIKKRENKIKRKKFLFNNWKFWISTGLVITGLVIAYFSFLSSK